MYHLQQRGIAHLILPLVLIVVIGVAGAFWLVSSDASTKKTKVKLVALTSKVDQDNKAYVQVQIKAKGGVPISQATCQGDADIAIRQSNGMTLSSGVPHGVQWVNDKCVTNFPATQLQAKKGNARAYVVYNGSATYYSAKKTITVKRPKVQKPSNSNPEMGPVIVAPAE